MAHSLDRIIGIDLGGTKSAACVADRSGNILFRVARPTPAAAGPDAVIANLCQLARDAIAAADGPVAGVGVSAGAPADAARGFVFDAPNLPSGGAPDGLPLAAHLSHELGGLPVFLENDADATALAEHRFGAGKGTGTMLFLTVGTGIGAGLVLDGRLHRGARGAGGEVGHIAVEPGGRVCPCGLCGCLEAYASGPSLVRVAEERGFGGERNAPAVLHAARAGDASALFAVDQAGEMLGRALATLSMLLNPEIIVLGTLAVHAGDLLLPRVDSALRAGCWPRIAADVRVVAAALGDRAQDLAAACAFLAREAAH
jgi:glucokinase